MKTRFLSLVLTLAMLLSLLPVLPAWAAEEGTPAPRAELYASGMKLGYFAYGEAAVADGKWQPTVGTVPAELRGDWQKAEGGLSYSLSAVGDTGLYLPFDALPAGDFTVEMALTPHGLTQGGEKVTFATPYGVSYAYGFAFGPFKGYVYPALREAGVSSPTADGRYCSWQVMWYYAREGYNYNWLSDDYSFHKNMDRPLTYGLTADFANWGVEYALWSNGENHANVQILSDRYVTPESSDGRFNLITSFPSTVFAVRVYDRVLSEAEQKQNRFADVCHFGGIEEAVAERFATLSEGRRGAIVEEYWDAEFGDSVALAGILDALALLSPEDLLVENPRTPAEMAQDAFARLAMKHGLDLSPLSGLSEEERLEIYAIFTNYAKLPGETLAILLRYHAGDANALATGALSYLGVSLRDDRVTGVRNLFRMDRFAVSILEEEYKITVGCLVARGGEDGFTPSELRLTFQNGQLQAPKGARLFTVYQTDGVDVNGHFTAEGGEEFAVTVDLGDPTSEDYDLPVVAVGFMAFTKDGKTEVRYVGSALAHSFRGVASEEYQSEKGDEEKMDRYIDTLQADLRAKYERLANAPVRVAGMDPPASEPAIWIHYVPDFDPWPDDPDPDKRGIKAAFIYYPMQRDPSRMSDYDKELAGAMRTFCYIGMPHDTVEYEVGTPGIVCVHGGAGHAYAEYVLEAVKQGFCAIAPDTEGCQNKGGRGTPHEYSAAESHYARDSYGHKGKDGFANADGPFTEQWLYWAVADTVLANSVLRSLEYVEEDQVGLTGISWGGLITTTAVCYDQRFAFAVPVYIAFHMAESVSASVGGLPSKPFAAALWQDSELLAKSKVPVLMLASDRDHFASPNTNQATYRDLCDGTLIYKPAFGHSQQEGATPNEIYRFGLWQLGYSEGFVSAPEISAEMGRSYRLKIEVPDDMENVTATLYYRTSPIGAYDSSSRPEWKSASLRIEGGEVLVEVPSDAVMYYISFSGIVDAIYEIKDAGTPYGYADRYARGAVLSSTIIVTF